MGPRSASAGAMLWGVWNKPQSQTSLLLTANNTREAQHGGIFKCLSNSNVMLCAIWYHLYNLKNVKSTYGGVLLLVKLQASACNFTKSNTPRWVFFTFFKLYKWYQIVQNISNDYGDDEMSISNKGILSEWITFCHLILAKVNGNHSLPLVNRGSGE